ncbi:uncharacterized protein LOC127872575 [Dreissena polymorpha]|uniref:G-protein coupled receptors family 1 profile domain-containing protein n=1 Tax=Dreissena polymorpha TaxID=45954 RepID=A0A9D4R7N8_DREPO|nr:uncharacterized protein LOC127872575 [Dreissena polymorpha]KAH3857293.1 hypothetical protein DPMN_099899 [Dreissena polymorpha]
MNVSETLTEDDVINSFNHEFTINALPVIVFMAMMSTLGVLGNIVVINVYSRKYPTCNFKYFVLILAIIDLFSCALLMPLEIMTLVYWYVFPFRWLCKLKSFFNAYTVTSSASSLLLISMDRYRKVCKPHSKQIMPRMALKLTLVVLGLSLVPAISDAVWWGTHTFQTEYMGQNIVVKVCEKDDKYKDTIWPTLHTLVLYGTSNLIIMLATMILYILIAVKMFAKQTVPFMTKLPRISISTTTTNPTSPNSESAHERENVFKFPSDIESGLSDTDDGLHSINLSDDVITDCESADVTEFLSGEDEPNDYTVQRSIGDATSKEEREEDEALELQEQVPLKTTLSCDVTDYPTMRRSHSDLNIPRRCHSRHVRISLEILSDRKEYTESLEVPKVGIRRKIPKPLKLLNVTKSRHNSSSPRDSPSKYTRKAACRRRSTIASMPGKRGTRLRRKTLIMFILTTTFVVTTVLYLGLIGHMSRNEHYAQDLNQVELTVWMFFLRLYFINSVINPVLYGFLDPRFRSSLWGMGVRFGFIMGSLKKTMQRVGSGNTQHAVTENKSCDL